MTLPLTRASPVPEDKTHFRRSPLGQTIGGVNDPVAALKLLSQKRRQYEDIQKRTDLVQNQRIQLLFTQLTEEKNRYDRMPAVKTSPRPKKKRNVRSRFLVETLVSGPRTGVEKAMPRLTGFWRKLQSEVWRPESRESAAMVGIGQKTYLIGGASRSIFNDAWVLYMANPKWVKAESRGVDAEPRMGHSAVEYEGHILVFGGVTAYNRGAKVRECLNTVKMLRSDSLEWRQINTSGTSVVMRRYHCAAVVGKHMLVYGGLSEKNNFMSDSDVLNMKSLKWKKVEVQGPGPGSIAFHSAVSVYPGNRPALFSLFSEVDFEAEDTRFFVKFPGIYVFGGLDANSVVHNEIYILQTGQRPLTWVKPEVGGDIPEPRFQHSFTMCPELNALLLFGGRNNTSINGGYTCFNDLHLLDLATLTWSSLILKGDVPLGRCAHATAVVGMQLVLFGGVDGGKYCNSDTYILELDQKVAFEMIREKEKREKRAAELQLSQEHRKSSLRKSADGNIRSKSVALGALGKVKNLDMSCI